MKNIIVRSLSGAVFVALIVCSILFGGAWGFPVVCCIFAILGMMEFLRMTKAASGMSVWNTTVDLLIGLCAPVSVALFVAGSSLTYVTLSVMSVLFLVRMVMQLYSHDENPVRDIACSVMSVVYVAFPLALAVGLYGAGKVDGAAMMLLIFVMIWLNDTGAFLVGSAIGKHRLFPRLSPKKSWEGFWGGMVFCVAAGIASLYAFPEYFHYGNVLPMALLGLVVSVASTWGDLFESMIKRAAGVKDSGNIMPGHGGMLDRIDSLLFVTPFVMVYLTVWEILF